MGSYGSDVRHACRRQFVEEGASPEAISEGMDGKPAAATIYRWAGPKPKEGETAQEGTWWAERAEHEEELYRASSPASLVRDVAELLQEVKESNADPGKKADSYAKLAAAVDKLTRPEMQLPVMYHVLEQFVLDTKRHYPDHYDRDFIMRVRAFKNRLRLRVERGGL